MTDQTLNINELTDLEIDSVNGGVEPVTTTIIVVGVVVAAVGALAAVFALGYTFGKDLAT
jgi:lactobin A/cerein 7B family class IIb bacteriocin